MHEISFVHLHYLQCLKKALKVELLFSQSVLASSFRVDEDPSGMSESLRGYLDSYRQARKLIN